MDGAGLTFVLNKLSDLLERQVGLIAGAEDIISSLRDDLSLLTIFLEGINDQRDGATALMQELMHQLRRVSWKAEDVVDQYMLDVARHESMTFLKDVFTGNHKGQLADQAQTIKQTVEGIMKNKEMYGIQKDDGAPSNRFAQQNGEIALDLRRRLDRWRRNVEEEEVVGFDQQFGEVIRMLRPEGCVEADQLLVVSIIGMGGLGKTTLARKIFKSEKIHFDTRVWVVVSEHADGKQVLKNILQCLKVSVKKDDDGYLKERLKHGLDGKRYLIVLDDLWTPEQWEELKTYFPSDQKRGSRILLTSRIKNVAYTASAYSTTYHLNPLGDDDSLILFRKKALKGKEFPSHLESKGKEIVSKCKGLPLAIVVLSGLLSAAEENPSFRRWSDILNDKIWLSDADNDCSKILSLSYRNLPPHLRTCFLYVGIFPEDFDIKVKDLCLLWVSEGFVKRRGKELEEDLAEEYLMNLADRNLIMISKRKSDGSIKSCRIHDLLRDLCIKEAERCHLYKVNADGASQNAEEGIRRLTNHKSYSITPLPSALYKGLRTLLDFSTDNSSNLRSAYEHLSDRRKAPIRTKNLILLRYLKVHLIGRMNLSESFILTRTSKTSNLQVLNLENRHQTTNLPKGIWKLKFLRHIYVRKMATMPGAQSSHDSLPYLQTLSCIIYEEHTSEMLCPARFPNLRKLYVNVSPNNPLGEESLRSLPELRHLLALKIRFEHVSLLVAEPLYSLSLNTVALPSITKIHLNNTNLTSEHWKLLGKLKNLQVLKLSTGRGTDTASCKKERFLNKPLVFKAEAFPQLLHLKLRIHHPALILQNGALKALHHLIIHSWDSKLLALPEQLWLSSTLRQVKFVIDLGTVNTSTLALI
uniref:Uncharacterized protein n=1 Tax=Kalanchoe fedtschenkoi TaxID=63787 RepID=A0A7N0V9K3_KALFE